MIICGIDPGQKGGIALIRPAYISMNGSDIELIVMPEIQAFAAKMAWLAGDAEGAHVFIEKAQSFPGQGISSAFNYGSHFGELCGVLWACGLSHTLVSPKTWTKVIHAGTKDADPKKRTLEAMRRIFPKVDLVASPRSKIPHPGLYDALAIAEYGRRTLKV